MAKDLLKYIEELDAFGARFDRTDGEWGSGHDWDVLPEDSDAGPDRARDFLQNLGALPDVVYPRGALSIEEMLRGEKPPVRFFTVDARRLEETLCKLPSMETLHEVLEEGVARGAFVVVDDRVLVNVPAGDGSEARPTFEITDVVKRAAAAIKAREAAPVLQHLLRRDQAQDSADQEGPRSFPGVVQVRRQPNRPAPVLREGPRERVTGLRKRIRELVKRHPVVASVEDLGEDTKFVVKGGPVRLADGTYLPLEVVEEEARLALMERMRDSGKEPRTTVYARIEDLEPVPIPPELLSVEEVEEGLEDGGVPSAARIELAYRLMKGIQLDSHEGESLDLFTRSRFERVLGHGFANVKLHTGPAARWITESLSARAVTAGEHIFIPRERLQEGVSGQRTLAHELVHVKQQEEVGESRPRAELESEARAAESAVQEFPEMRWATAVVPPAPAPGKPEAQGVFMAEEERGTEPAAPGGGRRHIDLRSEEILEKLEERIRESEEREKEEARDRVF